MKSLIKIGLTVLTFMFSSCLDKYPDNAILDGEAIESVSEANQAVIGIYSAYRSSALHSGYLTLLPDIQCDLVYAVEGFSNTYSDIWRWEILSNMPRFTPSSAGATISSRTSSSWKTAWLTTSRSANCRI